MGAKVWFITGASRGFGRIWAEAALTRGDKVVATARTVASLAGLKDKYGDNVLTLVLDVTVAGHADRAIAQAARHFGQLDIVINCAGYSLVGAIEEASIDEVRALFETNVYGAISVIQAALPVLRTQKRGHIICISSVLGQLAIPLVGYYCSSKWAFEAIHEALAAETRELGINVTLVEPGGYATDFGIDASLRYTKSRASYDQFNKTMQEAYNNGDMGDPKATTEAMFRVVDAAQPPSRIFLGDKCISQVSAAYNDRLSTWKAWEDISNRAQNL